MASEIKTIGFIGVGTMGRGMVKNLAKNNFKVLVYNRTRSKIEDLKSDMITIVDSIEETGAGDVVITCLPSDDSFRNVVLDSGLLPKLENKYLVDCGTTSIELTEKTNSICKGKKVDFMDAPITGSKLKAADGTMTMMMGGNKDTFNLLLPVFQAMGTTHVYCGGVTYGQRAKLALNMAQAMILESYLESLVFAVKNGVPLEAMEKIMDNSAAKSGVGSFKMKYIKKRDFEQHFMLKLMHKDLIFAESEMKKLNLDLPLAKHIREIFEKSLSKHGDSDMSSIVKKLEEHASIELKD